MNSSSIDVHNMEYKAKKGFFEQSSRYLAELLKTIVTYPSQFIEHDQLAAFNISLTDFSLDSDLAFDAVPQFFKPFPHDLMEESFKHSSQLEDDIVGGLHMTQSTWLVLLSHMMLSGTLGEYHRYVIAKWEESPSGRSMWQARW